jgi:hypothetical protein
MMVTIGCDGMVNFWIETNLMEIPSWNEESVQEK